MKDEQSGDQIVARIGFAETWLGRAKRQVAEGHLARGILTLVLADAEVHHAIEVAGAPRRPAAARVPAYALPLVLLALAAAAAIGLARSAAPASALPDDAAPAVVTLAAHTGSVLRLIPAPPDAAEAPPAEPASQPAVPERPGRPMRPARVSPIVPALPIPADAQAGPTVPSVTPAPVATAPPEPLVQTAPASSPAITLTAGDLIDLVLAAERTLRGGQGR